MLPSVSLLHLSAVRTVDEGEAAGRGRILEQSLAQHGVDTTLVGDDGRSHGDTLRARARSRGEGGAGDVAATRHRLCDGCHRRAHPRPDPGQVGDRRRSAQPHPPARRPRRPPARTGGGCRHRPARGGHRQGHRRQTGVPRPRHDPARAHRRGHRRRQVELPQLHARLTADAPHSRPGAPHPHRPQAGRDGPVQPPPAPPDATGHQPEEGRQRPRLGRQGDGAPLRPAVRPRLPRHRRVQRRLRRRQRSIPTS